MSKIFSLLFIVVSSVALGQNKILDPPFMNKVYLVEAAKDSLKQLAEETAMHSNKMAVFGHGQSGMDYSMDGAQSTVRISLSDTAAFAVSISGMMAMDPTMMFTLYRCTVKGNKRVVTISGSASNDSKDQNIVMVNVKKIKDDVYELFPASKLEAGEYAFDNYMSSAMSGGKSMQMFTFGVDGK